MCISLSSTLSQFLITGFATFLPKIAENNFSLTPSTSSLIIGSIVVPGACLGALGGGTIIKRLNMGLGKICLLCTICSFCALCCVPSFMIKCKNVEFITPNYFKIQNNFENLNM